MRTIDRNYLIALALFGNGGNHKDAATSGRQLLVDAVDAKLNLWGVNPTSPIQRKPDRDRLASMSLSFSIGSRVVNAVKHPSEFPQPTKPTKATPELLQRYESRVKGWESMQSNAQSDVAFIQSLAATLGLTEVAPQAVVDAESEYADNTQEPTLADVVGRTNAAILADHPSPKLDTVQAVKDAIASGFDLTDVDGIGPKKAIQIKELIGL